LDSGFLVARPMTRTSGGTGAAAALSVTVAIGAGALATSGAAPVLVAGGLLAVLVIALFAVARQSVPSAGARAPTPGGWRFAFGTILAGFVFYTLLFNFLSNNVRVGLAGALAAALTAVSVIASLRAGRQGQLLVFVCAMPLVLMACGALVGLYRLHATATFRDGFPLFVAAAVVLVPDLIPRRTVGALAGVLILVGTGISFRTGHTLIGGVTRLGPFTGGIDGDHSSAYAMGVAVVLLNELRRAHDIRSRWAVPLMAIGMGAIVEYRVATVAVMLMVYLAMRAWPKAQNNGRKVVILGLIAGALVLGYQLRVQEKQSMVYGDHTLSVNSLSSGRTGAWDQRVALLDGRRSALAFFGSGTGSDVVATNAWSGEEKGSHDDFLTALTERGLFGLTALVVSLTLLAKTAGPPARPLFAMLIVSGLLSNGLLSRPTLAPLFWLAVGLAAAGGPFDPPTLGWPTRDRNGHLRRLRGTVTVPSEWVIRRSVG
jgi:hypothetical protein